MSVLETYEAQVAEGALQDDPVQRAVLPELERIRAAVAQPVRRGWFAKKPDPVPGLYIWGGVGRGKSMLMDLFVDTLDVPARRVHFHAFMQEVQAGIAAARERGIEDAIQPVADKIAGEARVLAFDEMQITDIADAMIVGRLFQKLFDQGVVVVTTSNRVPADLYKDGLNRDLFLPFIALLEERMVVHHLSSDTDYRQDRLAGATVYFTPLGREAREAVDAVWQDLTDGAPASPLTLVVKGREVVLPAFHNGVARVTFYDLCGSALGPADYLAVAEAVRVLLLEDIPELGRSNFNEARRFVTLIDALYEARVRLVASAARRPEMLYLEGTGAFEFERTASRLREMMSDGWGA
ncbi:cell division protein ZapE [Pseudaestuariivita atlantica]|uniref:ATPase n=1 Tax=Pseudaestuariivita atlantica TaxID=1317121 RepID=A0A0L1JSC1_9RHOB|nr:cell division protein ZapE [Pseudaestuariivita atlantica]KNG94684.1 ATPase [Pseudaestuariivita atlantica]